MRYKLFGKHTGLRVSELVLGTGSFGTRWGHGSEPDEAKRMLEFVAESAAKAGLEDYRLIVNVGPGGGQTVFHLHWHLLGGASLPGFE